MSVLRNWTGKYSSFDAWAYDTFIAPAVATMALATVESSSDPWLRELFASGKILDVGCGGGQIAISLAKKFPQTTFTGLDLSEQQISRAKIRGQGVANITFQTGNAMELPFPNASFDAVVSFACLKHWPDKVRGFQECVRVLKAGGRLFIAEADRSCSDEAVTGFVSNWRLPKFLKKGSGYFFRTYVAGQSVTRKEVEGWGKDLKLRSFQVGTEQSHPAVWLRGEK